ncbi:MAG: RNA polymerase sigma factor [Saprospiraceae bacterium]
MDQLEFRDFVRANQNKIFRFALRLIPKEDDAKDIVQDVLIKIWDRRDELAKIENIDGWMYTVTRNLCIDRIRAKKVHLDINTQVQVADKTDSPYEQTSKSQLLKLMRKLIDEMPEKQKLVIHLRDIEGLSYDEIAQSIGIPLAQVKVNLHRARLSLKDKIIKSGLHGQI